MHCLYGGYNLHRFSDALGLVSDWFAALGVVGTPYFSKVGAEILSNWKTSVQVLQMNLK